MTNEERARALMESHTAEGFKMGALGLVSLSARIAAALREAEARGLERGAEIALKTIPRAHTYASENADVYRAGDSARDTIIAALRAEAAEVRRGKA